MRLSQPEPHWLTNLLKWFQDQLEICGRSLVLLYFLAVCRVFLYATRLIKGEQGGNANIRDCRFAVKGAPLLLVLFWHLPLCHAMAPDPAVAHGVGVVCGLDDASQCFDAPPQSFHTASSSSDAFRDSGAISCPGDLGPVSRRRFPLATSDGTPASVKAVAKGHRATRLNGSTLATRFPRLFAVFTRSSSVILRMQSCCP